MAPGGIIAVHISNRHLDLEPVVVGLADEFHLEMVACESSSDAQDSEFSTEWVLLTNNEEFLARPRVEEGAEELTARPCYWTDDFSDLFSIIRWRR
jgi:CTP:phosphocholine cytidylyltransferase-like protein